MHGLTRRRAAVTSVVVVVLASVGAWNQRRSLADGAIANALAARGVEATYRVANIGLRWERLEDIVIGDPRNPDLTADWAEVRVAATLGGLKATAIRAGGVRLRGRLVGGKISFGQIDRLIPAPTGAPFALPDLTVDLKDARIALSTPFGEVGGRLDGGGNLADGFRGKLAAISPVLAIGNCKAQRATIYVDVAITNRAPSVKGPMRADSLKCGMGFGSVQIDRPALGLNVALSEAFNSWHGTSSIDMPALAAGANKLSRTSGWISLAGDAKSSKGSVQVQSVAGSTKAARMQGLSLDGSFAIRGSNYNGKGSVKALRVAVDQHYAGRLQAIARSAASSPVGPLLDKLSIAVANAGKSFSLSADIAATLGASGASAILTTAEVAAPGGMRLHVGGGQGVALHDGKLMADTQGTLKGGGFPSVTAVFRRLPDGTTSGTARIEPYEAKRARLALSPVRFSAKQDGAIRLDTVASLDGPLGDGRIDGLRMPIALGITSKGDVRLNPGCTPASFRLLSVSGLRLDPASLRVCAVGDALIRTTPGGIAGGAVIASPRLTGRLGSSPVTINAGQVRVTLADSGFAVGRLGVKIGDAARQTSLDVGTLDGGFFGGTVRGRFGGLSGKIGNVPLLIDSGGGNWTLKGGILDVEGVARVSDEAKPVRFNTLAAEDIKLRLANGRVAVAGVLREPLTKADVSTVRIEHDLGSGKGRALLDVAGLKFGDALQPEKLTPLTLGVVANVVGTVAGKGEIDWSPAGVTSSGRFATEGLDFAAAFGPVSGLSGEIVFSDLLGLVTEPGQSVSIAVVNPGIPVPDGRVTYHLAAGQRIVVEGGRWPFAGGALILDPTTLDMGESRERRLTFRVEALDAAKFIQQLEFDDLAATGIFDGSMPMIFDDQGGRIVGGKIVARRGGGTLSYVGDVSNAQMNVYAKLAFDALKAIRYDNLSIEMDGALDGEIVSKVNFRGVNEAPRTEKRGYLARQFSNLPFIFNITIRAPFRGLLTTARTFQDPSSLFRGLPPSGPAPKPAIQPLESEKRP